jgi:hypothetical protein
MADRAINHVHLGLDLYEILTVLKGLHIDSPSLRACAN